MAEDAWLPDRMIAIETEDGGRVGDFSSLPSWRDTSALTRYGKAKSEPDRVRFADLLAETHHRAYGRPWILGRLYFEHLLTQAIRPSDRILDIGCGAGRIAIWLVPWLEQARYFGFDGHLASLVAFAAYEARMFGLAPQRPRILWTQDFAADAFGARFDVVLDFYVTVHLGEAVARRAYERIGPCCAPGARLFLCSPPPLPLADMAALGWALAGRGEVAYDLAIADPGFKAVDDWHEFRRI